MYADSKEDFCRVRFADILARRGGGHAGCAQGTGGQGYHSQDPPIASHQDSGGDGGHQVVGGGQHHLPPEEPGGE